MCEFEIQTEIKQTFAKMFSEVYLLNFISKWYSCHDNSGEVGTIVMDLSKAFDCLLHELVL